MEHAETRQTQLRALTKEGVYFESCEDQGIECYACANACRLQPGKAGICRVRFNDGGRLRVPWGYVSGLAVDPIEKKPFYHFLPGAATMSFGMLGCNFKCSFCQNWFSSQVLKDAAAEADFFQISAEQIVETARSRRIKIVVSTYNEPMITSEWAAEVFRLARREGMKTGFVSNGFGTQRIVDELKPLIDCWNVDLKSFRDGFYRTLGGRLQAVCDTIRAIHAAGIWCEVITLLIPGQNDSFEEVRDMARFVASVSPSIPWHISAYHPDYKMTDGDFTSPSKLLEAAQIGKEAGLEYVYAGNVAGAVGDLEKTFCPKCRQVLIERVGFRVLKNRLGSDGMCSACNHSISGVWV